MVEHKIIFDDEGTTSLERDMKISPKGILEKEFPLRFRGYDVNQVDAFLEDLARELERIAQELLSVQDEREQLKEELAVLRERERNLKEELLVAQTIGDDIRARAEQEASRIIAGAQLDAQKILAEVRQQCASLQQEITAMNQKREQFETSLRALLEGYLNIIRK